MHIYKDLYCDEACQKNKHLILHKLRLHMGLKPSLYLIALAEGRDYFDLIPGYVLKQKYYPLKELYLMGIADGYDAAVSLAQRMIEEFTETYKTVYFKDRLWELF